MSADRLRYALIAVLALAALVSVVANKSGSHALRALSFALFVVVVVGFVQWRRRVRREHSARVFDREAKTDETGSRTDQ